MRSPRTVRLAFVVLLLLAVHAPARAVDWPASGAPVCNAPGDQSGILHRAGFCAGMQIWWHDQLSDSLRPGFVTPEIPDGTCQPTYEPGVPAPGARDGATTLGFNGLIALIGCIDRTPCHVWIEGTDPTDEKLVLHVPFWFGQQRSIADDGVANRYHPRLAPSGSLYAIDTAMVVVWTDDRTGVAQIRAQRINWKGGREWGPNGLLVAPTGTGQGDPDVMRLGDGSSLIVWTDARSGQADIYAMRLLTTGLPASGWPAGGMAFESRAEQGTDARLVGDEFQPPYVVWTETGARFGGGRDIVARRLQVDGVPDPAWSTSGVPLSTSATVDQLDDVHADHQGGIVAVWTDVRAASPANPTDLYAQRIDASGSVASGWPASGLAVCTAPGRQENASVDVHFNGSPVFAWEDERGADRDIYAMLLTPTGGVPCCLWGADGLPATLAAGIQTGPVVEADNGGGLFVAWVDRRDVATTGTDVYAQAFTNEGRNADVPGGPRTHATGLQPPAPNPSRGTVDLSIVLTRPSRVSLEVLDLAGRRVRTIAAGALGPGPATWRWDGADDHGRPVRAGVYRLRAVVNGASQSRALVRLN